MGLLDNTTQNQYYQGNEFGSYQFTSLDDIISQFMIVYVGEDKLISKIKRTDVAFHAQRALAELSFDTFKSIKAQEIVLPPSLTMILPHDYVNYTKISWSDSAGIKHPLYPTKHTSNPFSVKQNDDKSYFFGEEGNVIKNPEFDVELEGSWNFTTALRNSAWDSTRTNSDGTIYYTNYLNDIVSATGGQLEFDILWNNGYGVAGGSKSYAAWQRVDVNLANQIELTATATSGARQTATVDGVADTLICDYGVVRVGITTTNPDIGWPTSNGDIIPATYGNPYHATYPSPNTQVDNFDLGYMEWSDGTTSQKELLEIDVSAHTEVWVYVQSFSPWTTSAITTTTHTWDHDNDPLTAEVPGPANGSTVPVTPTSSVNNTHQKNTVDFISVVVPGQNLYLANANSDENSTTWGSYKSITPSENNNDDYEDEVYWPYEGERYGLEPSHAQVNGSFYIDEIRGKIHFSSNISGKNIILDYISDSLGTDSEMKVHKFAEEAMYRWILHAIASGRIQTQQIVPRLKKEKFAAVRQAKLRLSNIKLEEITQILRGKSKQIKH